MVLKLFYVNRQRAYFLFANPHKTTCHSERSPDLSGRSEESQ